MRYRTVFAVLLLTASAAGCGGNETPPAELAIDDAWARPTPEGASNGVVYLTITSSIDDQIVAVEVAPTVAAAASLHSSGGTGDDQHEHHGETDGGMASMQSTDTIELPAGEPFVFAAGSNHIMLEQLSSPLKSGATFVLKFELASGRSVEANVVVADSPPE